MSKRRVARRHGHTFTGAAAALPRFHSLRKWDASCARDEAERERRALDEMRARERGEWTPSASRIESWMCDTCREWTMPRRSRDGASCHRCGGPRRAAPTA